VIAGGCRREQRQRDRGHSRRRRERGVAAFELGERGLQVGHRRHAVQPVDDARIRALHRRFQIRDAIEQDSRGAIDRRVYRAHVRARLAA
jgi:hypothetical protein